VAGDGKIYRQQERDRECHAGPEQEPHGRRPAEEVAATPRSATVGLPANAQLLTASPAPQ
jgi:hypothetical protein